MFWTWFFLQRSNLFQGMKVYLSHHSLGSFRTLLFAGDLLIFLLLVQIFSSRTNTHMALWFAGGAVTLSLLFVCALISTVMKGYRRYRDGWLGCAVGLMLLLSLVMTLTSL